MNEKHHTSQNNLISILDLSRSQIENIITTAAKFKNGEHSESLKNKIIACCFFEASTRTRLSFETAILKLSGKVIGFADASSTSCVKKFESLSDTIKIISGYADAIVMRHPGNDALKLAAKTTDIPVINAGDGSNEHPTQTLIDLFCMHEIVGKLDGINLVLFGDLLHGRAIHSLILAALIFKINLFFVAPKGFKPDANMLQKLTDNAVRFSIHDNINDVLPKADIVYLTRPQVERFSKDIQADYKLDLNTVRKLAKPTMKILHPLPRQQELSENFDDSHYAYYFTQAKNGVYVRQALLTFIFENCKNAND
ncbi:MAG: aspartate carbamoyltransferase [Thiotrichales bacterium]|nr:MAG: aspartate carbamoyltransferase [Thiotrichales bacterium]